MTKSTEKPQIVTADYVIDMYLEAKKLRGKKRKGAMEYVVILSKNLNHLYPRDKDV